MIELDLDAKIVPTYSFEEIRNQIEEKWKEEIKTKMGDVSENILRNIKIFYTRKKYFIALYIKLRDDADAMQS